MVFTVKSLIDVCVRKRGRLKPRDQDKRAVYEELWRALNEWMQDRYMRKLGLRLGQLGEWNWESYKALVGKPGEGKFQSMNRPFFQLSDHFMRTYNIKMRKPVRPPKLAKCEELNATKIAIKYSTMLTKDLVFSGLRDFIYRIGDAVTRGEEVAIGFCLGVFYARDRRVSFQFDPKAVPGALPMAMRPAQEEELRPAQEEEMPEEALEEEEEEDAEEEAGEYGEEPQSEFPQSEGVAAPEEEDLRLPLDQTNLEPAVDEEDEQGLYPIDEMGAVDDRDAAQALGGAEMYDDEFDAGRGNSRGVGVLPSERSDAFSTASTVRGLDDSRVVEDAYRRHLQYVQQMVEESAFEKQQFVKNLENQEMDARERRRQRLESNKRLQGFQRDQIKERVHKAKEQRHKDLTTKTHCSFPPLVHSAANGVPGGLCRMTSSEQQKRVRMRAALKTQMQAKEQLRRRERHSQLEEERQFLDQVQNRMLQNKQKMMQKRLQVKEKLLQAWERDKKMKQLLQQGIKLQSTIRSPQTARSTMSEYSIGYDQRF